MPHVDPVTTLPRNRWTVLAVQSVLLIAVKYGMTICHDGYIVPDPTQPSVIAKIHQRLKFVARSHPDFGMHRIIGKPSIVLPP
jgi:hypothetical protein